MDVILWCDGFELDRMHVMAFTLFLWETLTDTLLVSTRPCWLSWIEKSASSWETSLLETPGTMMETSSLLCLFKILWGWLVDFWPIYLAE